jgi:TonB family protein
MIAHYFLIATGSKLQEYEVTLQSQTTLTTAVELVVQTHATTRKAAFNATFAPNPRDKVNPTYDVIVIFPWEHGEAPRVMLDGYGNLCGPVELQSSGVSQPLLTFDDRNITLQQDLSVSIVSQSGFVNKVTPVYPEEAKEQGISGRVQIAVVVGTKGRVLTAWVFKSSLSNLLDDAALTAAKASTFEEPQSAGQPSIEAFTIEYDFAI